MIRVKDADHTSAFIARKVCVGGLTWQIDSVIPDLVPGFTVRLCDPAITPLISRDKSDVYYLGQLWKNYLADPGIQQLSIMLIYYAYIIEISVQMTVIKTFQ